MPRDWNTDTAIGTMTKKEFFDLVQEGYDLFVCTIDFNIKPRMLIMLRRLLLNGEFYIDSDFEFTARFFRNLNISDSRLQGCLHRMDQRSIIKRYGYNAIGEAIYKYDEHFLSVFVSGLLGALVKKEKFLKEAPGREIFELSAYQAKIDLAARNVTALIHHGEYHAVYEEDNVIPMQFRRQTPKT